MKQGSTLFLKIVLSLIGAVVLALSVFIVPIGIRTDTVGAYRPILFGLYPPAIPFFLALYQAFTLLTNIDKNRAFSNGSIRALKNIKLCAIIISVYFSLGMPYIFYVAQLDDAPGVVAIGLIIIGASIVIATFAAVLQKLILNGVKLKSENDLTV